MSEKSKENIGKCAWCGWEKKLDTCRECGMKGVVNAHKEIFEEDVFDKLNPKLEEINWKIDNLIENLKNIGIKQITTLKK